MVEVETKIQRYESYKDSGVEWLGEIPDYWEVKPGFTILSESKKKNIGFIEDTVLSLSYGNVIIKPKEKLTGLVPESFETYQLVEPGDIIIRPTDLQNDKTSLRTGLAKDNGIITSAYINLRVNGKNDNAFYHYYLYTIDINKVIYGLGSGLRQNISFWDFKRFPFPFPPLSEQTQIAQFLDDKTTKIDEAIAIKEQQINLLEEHKQILIHKAVTRGLDASVALKDSGVEWIGEIPAHWEVKNLRYAFEFLNNRRIPLSAIEREKMQGKYPYYGASGIIDYVDDYIFEENLILIGEDGANLLSKSTPLAFVAEGKYWVNNHAHILRPLFKGFPYWAEQLSLIDYTIFISGAAQPKLSRGNLGSVKVIVPSLNDLKEISAYIETASQKIETAISLKQQEIEKLKEYKRSLINSVVTGKVRVC